MSGRGDAWFVVARAPGKISATPVGARGWLALGGFASGAVLVAALLMSAMRGWHPIAVVAVLLPVLTAAILGFFRWIVLPHAR